MKKRTLLALLGVSTSLVLTSHATADDLDNQQANLQTQITQIQEQLKANESKQIILSSLSIPTLTKIDLVHHVLEAHKISLESEKKKIDQLVSERNKVAEKQKEELLRAQKAEAEKKAQEEATAQQAAKQKAPVSVQASSNPSVQEAFSQLVNEYNLSAAEQSAWSFLIEKESGGRVDATNTSSGAYGLGQALPASKMAAFGDDYLTNPLTQLKWMYSYMVSRYGGILQAQSYWLSVGWY